MSNTYTRVQFTVSNAQPSQSIVIDMDTTKKDVSWSLGQDFSSSSGLSIQMTGGAELPLTQLRVTAAEITIGTSDAGSGQIAFTFSLFVASKPDVESIRLKSSSDSGIVLTVSINGGVAQAVNHTFSGFDLN
ncbi:hypothetical protein ACS0ZG_18750 [Burkholderia gladioli]|jgi:hypothetical protein|uniref:Uncharacterized protein n=2 Tax=Burkholderia gladioli TaxID=28095 RepID=A0AB38TYU2_BURGA|nr:hypothetical protein [Burkholderia gladioli]KAF1060283.1 hypothetical protein LvStA_06886 [Burkholderia gladioli]KKJ08144.1 hypothetical protein XF14_00985 [Burkholderia gladioli]MBA1364093.1 hypothetical protein [Burkholderia gladioli]MBJ9679204.1 hypothetical protein [Burkholderia gladioli]MBU9173657.1 hypothetical protein [Burkholderia gladioli]